MKTLVVTPREARSLALRYGFAASPFGETLIGWCEKGIAYLGFVVDGREGAVADLARRWPSPLTRDDKGAQELSGDIFDRGCAGRPELTLLLKGTDFQIAVWRALLDVPFGKTTSYTAVAASAGRERAVRAAASAVGDNNISYLVPCHRVLRRDGSIGGYFWGLDCKRRILDWESRG